MSSSNTEPARATASPSPYPRANYWGEADESSVVTSHVELRGTEKEAWIAHQILRHGADFLCPECIDERGASVVISDPEEHVPKIVETEHGFIELHVLRFRRRVCPDCGCVSWGGKLADRPVDEFCGIVRDVLGALSNHPEHYREKLFSDAKARKCRGMDDEKVMRALVRDLLDPSE